MFATGAIIRDVGATVGAVTASLVVRQLAKCGLFIDDSRISAP